MTTPQLRALGYSHNMEEKAFCKELMSAVNQYLKNNNDHQYANFLSWLKIFILLGLSIVCYLTTLTTTSKWLFFISYFGFFISCMFAAINILHDAAHDAILKNTWKNRLLCRLVSIPLGIDADFWRVRHAHFHHTYPNVEHYDLDTEENGFFRQTPFQKWRWYMKYQTFYWPFIASLSLPYISWIFDWSDKLGKTQLKYKNVLTGFRGWLVFLISKALHFIITLIIPIYLCTQHLNISWTAIFFSYLLSLMLASLMIVFLFLGTHWTEPKFTSPPDSGPIQHSWFQQSFDSTCDWMPTPAFLGVMLGGIHLHLTHHLFPKWHHRHYKQLSKIIAPLAIKYGFNYRLLSYRQLMQSQHRFLKEMGKSL